MKTLSKIITELSYGCTDDMPDISDTIMYMAKSVRAFAEGCEKERTQIIKDLSFKYDTDKYIPAMERILDNMDYLLNFYTDSQYSDHIDYYHDSFAYNLHDEYTPRAYAMIKCNIAPSPWFFNLCIGNAVGYTHESYCTLSEIVFDQIQSQDNDFDGDTNELTIFNVHLYYKGLKLIYPSIYVDNSLTYNLSKYQLSENDCKEFLHYVLYTIKGTVLDNMVENGILTKVQREGGEWNA